MQINRNNYEAFVIDYLEGNLTPDVRQAVEAFLLAHPDIQAECEDLMGFALPKEDFLFEEKHQLKFDGEISRADELMLRALDGDLSSSERDELQTLLQHPQQAHNFDLLKASFLRPENLEFGDKRFLRFADRLTTQQERELEQPQLLPVIRPQAGESWDKSILYFPETLDYGVDENLAAALAEGDLQGELQTRAQQKAAASADFAKQVAMFQQIRLQPKHVVFEHKASLKKQEARIVLFTPAVRRAAAIAALFVVSLGIWRPWENTGFNNQHAEHNNQKETKLPDVAPSSDVEVASSEQTTKEDSIAEPSVKHNDIVQPAPMRRNHEDVAQQTPTKIEQQPVIAPIDTVAIKSTPSVLQTQEDQLAEQAPSDPVKSVYVPIAKDNALKPAEAAAPVTLIAFLGDKLEQRIEQSQVYSFLDKKKKEIFQTEDGKEPVRYERKKSSTQIKQKLVLWGLELERSKRKK